MKGSFYVPDRDTVDRRIKGAATGNPDDLIDVVCIAWKAYFPRNSREATSINLCRIMLTQLESRFRSIEWPKSHANQNPEAVNPRLPKTPVNSSEDVQASKTPTGEVYYSDGVGGETRSPDEVPPGVLAILERKTRR
jgi:hypothetical protein